MLITEVYQLIKKSFTNAESPAGFSEHEDPCVKAMILLHERLYQSRDLTRIDFSDYLCALVDEVIRPLISMRGDIVIEIKAGQVYMDIDTAILCGSLINELALNCLNHAFPQDRSGKLSIELSMDDLERYRLSVRDDGIGLPRDIAAGGDHTPGLNLVRMLVHQLRGNMNIECGPGTAFDIVFSGPKS